MSISLFLPAENERIKQQQQIIHLLVFILFFRIIHSLFHYCSSQIQSIEFDGKLLGLDMYVTDTVFSIVLLVNNVYIIDTAFVLFVPFLFSFTISITTMY